MRGLSVQTCLRMAAKGFYSQGDTCRGEYFSRMATEIDEEIKQKDEHIKKLEFMIDSGLGWEDMKGGNISDVS